MAKLHKFVLLLVAFNLNFSVNAQYSESLTGLNLLGDHFGVPGLNGTFDYVIVGGGTAGLTLAARLSEKNDVTVAVIEAGGFYEFDNGNLSQVPGDVGYFIGTAPKVVNPLIDWLQRTEPMPGAGGRSIFYNSGKTFGGGSARNFLVYDRPPVGALQRWADQVGDQSYTFANMLQYYQKSTTFQPPNNSQRPSNASINPPLAPWGGSTGPIRVSYPNWVNSFGSWAAKGLKELGLSEATDFVGGKLMGYQYHAMLLDHDSQTRCSSEFGYLRPSLKTRRNLTLYKQALAKRIIMNGTRATGVAVETESQPYYITAKKEVIISAGTFRSPQLLMVSGIGPAKTLSGVGVKVIKDLPGVGQNLNDQATFGPSYAVKLVSHSALGYNPALQASQLDQYNKNRTGMLTNPAVDFLAFEKFPQSYLRNFSQSLQSSLAGLPSDWPSILWVIDDGYGGYARDLTFDQLIDGKNYVTAVMALYSPFSKGNVTIKSADTSVRPLVNPNLLGDPRDQEQAIAMYKRARSLFATKALAPIVDGKEAFPGANVTTDAQLLELLKQSVNTIWHSSATNKMGRSNDTMAVVDTHAKVYGVQNLRVVDASIFPFLPPIHPTGTVYALAEKIAQYILNGT